MYRKDVTIIAAVIGLTGLFVYQYRDLKATRKKADEAIKEHDKLMERLSQVETITNREENMEEIENVDGLKNFGANSEKFLEGAMATDHKVGQSMWNRYNKIMSMLNKDDRRELKRLFDNISKEYNQMNELKNGRVFDMEKSFKYIVEVIEHVDSLLENKTTHLHQEVRDLGGMCLRYAAKHYSPKPNPFAKMVEKLDAMG